MWNAHYGDVAHRRNGWGNYCFKLRCRSIDCVSYLVRVRVYGHACMHTRHVRVRRRRLQPVCYVCLCPLPPYCMMEVESQIYFNSMLIGWPLICRWSPDAKVQEKVQRSSNEMGSGRGYRGVINGVAACHVA